MVSGKSLDSMKHLELLRMINEVYHTLKSILIFSFSPAFLICISCGFS